MPNRMDQEDARIIRLFAQGDSTLRTEAVAIHRKYIPSLGVRGTPEQKFMAEVDNPSPDAMLRARYRDELLRGE